MGGPDKILFSERCWLEGRLQVASVEINGDRIGVIHAGAKLQDRPGFIDFGRNILMPGVIDPHVHINEPGRTAWEGFEAATSAAAFGGVTTLIDMPVYSQPVTSDLRSLNKKLEAAKGKLHVNCGFWGASSDGDPENVAALLKAGCFGIYCTLSDTRLPDFKAISRDALEKLMYRLADMNALLIVHCELKNGEADPQHFFQQPWSYEAFLGSRAKSWENAAVQLILELCKKTHCRTHILQLGSAQPLNAILQAKDEKIPVTVETCPHYLLFQSEDIPDGSVTFKCVPPIRSKRNKELLLRGVAEGVIDLISSAHSPATPRVKMLHSQNLYQAWEGISGLQFLLPASWTALQSYLTLEAFIPLLTEAPARITGLAHRKGFIREGYDADLIVWDPEVSFLVTEKIIQHKHKISPYNGHELDGKVIATFLGGDHVFGEEKLLKESKGRCVFRNTG